MTAKGAVARVRDRSPRPDVLGIYLNDHLAGATGGVELARRVAGSSAAEVPRAAMEQLVTELQQDRSALLEFMRALGVPVRGYKVAAGWLGEKAGRLKLNGRLATRSPLSSLEELELLRLGAVGKAAGWRTLRTLAQTDRRWIPAGWMSCCAARTGRLSCSKACGCGPLSI